MLYISLIVSGILLAAVWLRAREAKHPVATTLGWAGGAAILPMFLMMVLPAVMLQAAILCGGVLLAQLFNRSQQAVRPLAVTSLLIAYGVVGWNAMDRYRAEKWKDDELRAAYPFESLEQRLPRPVPPSAAGDSEQLTRTEQAIERERDYGREMDLKRLHDVTVDRFVNSPGFGVERTNYMSPNAEALKPNPRDAAPPQPDYFHPGGLVPVADRVEANSPTATALSGVHQDGILDFVNPRGFGFVKDRRRVAGFQSHGFSKVPGPVEKWEVARLGLVGLLLHEKPVVYESAKLPRMDELRDAPTRPLDAFETTALAALRDGADLHIDSGADGFRFLGAIRSTKQCIECHGGQRGALLGAFSYRLRPAASPK